MGRKPLVGVTGCNKFIAPHRYFATGEKYVRAVAIQAGAVPVIIPPMCDDLDSENLLARLDGLLVTGSPSNVEPGHYGGADSRPGTLHDPGRDRTVLPLITRALSAGLPMLALCRGLQELNVALGGSLHQNVHEIPGRNDHRADAARPMEIQYGDAHPVALAEGGLLRAIAGGAETVIVNSIHSQGIDRLADGLTVEATAADGQIEAVRVADARAFALAVQWHPEWRPEEKPFYTAILKAFGDACRARATMPRRVA